MDTRVLIAVILSLAAVFAYQEFVLKRLYPPGEEPNVTGLAAPSGKATPLIAPDGRTASTAPLTGNMPAVMTPTSGSRRIEVQTDDYVAELTTRGGRLASLKLTKFRETAEPNSPLLELITPAPGGQLPLGLVLDTGSSQSDDGAVVYQTSAPDRIVLHGSERATVALSGATSNGVRLAKSVTFAGTGYVMGLETEGSGQQLKEFGVSMSESLTPHKGYNDVPEIQAVVSNKTVVKAEKALRKGVEPLKGPITYAGFGDRYFLTVFLPSTPHDGVLDMDFNGSEATATMLVPAAGANARIDSRIYMGPKELNTLEAVNPALNRSIDFGWTGILALAFLRALKIFHHITPNYGVDIILLTAAIRVLFLPMSIKSQRSMMRLQRLQPQVERLREKWKDDKERLNREMVDLYKRNHVNPLGGCAPMLLQLPIFIGLYEALLNAVELRHAPFVGWIRDLSAPECLPIPHFPSVPFLPCNGIPVLVLLMGASTYLQQYMSPQAADPNQQKMMMLMPIVFTIMFLNFPAGLSLYYFFSNVLGIAQQYFLNREFKQLSPANA